MPRQNLAPKMKRSTQEHAKNEKWEGGSMNWTASIAVQRLRQAVSREERFGWARQYGEGTKLAYRGWPARTEDRRSIDSRGLPRYRLCLQSRQLVQWTHSQKSNLRLWREDATSRRTGCRPGTEGKSDRYTSVRGHASLWSTLHIAE